MTDFPWFPLYVGDLISGTVDYSPNEFTALLRLMCYQWGKGPIPLGDERRLCQITGLMPDELEGVTPMIVEKFPDGLNPRLEEERDFKNKKSKGGKSKREQNANKSGTESDQNANRTRTEGRSKREPSQSQSQSQEEREEKPEKLSLSRSKSAGEEPDFAQKGIPARLEKLKTQLGAVQKGWGAEFNAVEREILVREGMLESVEDVEDEEWSGFHEMLSPKPKYAKRRELLRIGSPNRDKFLSDIGNYRANLARYRGTYPAPKLKDKIVPLEEPEPEVTAEMRERLVADLREFSATGGKL